MITEREIKNLQLRLKKIEGQIRGIQTMIEKEKYCIDIINQINASRRALDGVAMILMKRHMESCLTSAIKTQGGPAKIEEFIDSINRFVK